ncbi:hypothetical protein ACQR1Y_28240 [Bradyrhizobium sp. HKCCYLRH3099]|uniref:hypothetical protein n=1 Tax=unclassified Bradyrhizobium TaxID=2631580 RepID=UPI003EBBB82C
MTIDTFATADARTGSGSRPWPALSHRTVVALSVWGVLFAAELIVSLYLAGGRLVFTLDDGYIHLAVADQILAGGYGVNAGEVSSPSSSIIWPYLIALTEALHLGPWGPLLIGAAAAAATLVTIVRLLESSGLFDGERAWFTNVIALLMIFIVSAVALPMTGLEHSLHVWATVTTFAGLVEAARGRSPSRLQIAALVLLPLIRFEGAALACAALAGLVLLRQRRAAALAAGLIAVALLAYGARMHALGLPLLPSSVLLKARIAEAAYEHTSALGAIVDNLILSLINPYGQRLLLLAMAVAVNAWWLRSDRRALVVAGAVLAAIGGHVAFGQYDWFHRYEVYVIALGAVTWLWLIAQLKPQLDARVAHALKVPLLLLLGYASWPYASAAWVSPMASRNISQQQYQMGRFVHEFYPHPVAVNDLGLVAYRNPNYVLDLWGLGSEPVRKAKLAGRYGPDEMAALAAERGVGLVMIYDRWFTRGVPASWTKVAVLHSPFVTVAVGDVSFYRTPAADAAEVNRALAAFAPTLPPDVSLEILAP